MSGGPFKKRKKSAPKKGGLSFANDDEEAEDSTSERTQHNEDDWASVGATPLAGTRATTPSGNPPSNTEFTTFKKKPLRPNASVALAPRALTKSALLKETALKETLRKEYHQIQEAVKATEFIMPFVFYSGKNAAGGKVRLKKGEQIWKFLERARKVGAASGETGRKDWARISVDDLIIVKGDLILGHVSSADILGTYGIISIDR